MCAQFTQTTTFADGVSQTASGAQVNTEIVNLGTSVNDITNAQINASAAIAASKLTIGTFTAWTAWTPGYSGAQFAANPVPAVARYMQIGKIVTLVYVDQLTPGTSNGTSFTMTGVPVAPVYAIWFPLSLAINNSVRINTGVATIGAGGTTITCYTDHITPALWNGGGTKGAGGFQVSYEVA